MPRKRHSLSCLNICTGFGAEPCPDPENCYWRRNTLPELPDWDEISESELVNPCDFEGCTSYEPTVRILREDGFSTDFIGEVCETHAESIAILLGGLRS